jgi:transcription-repair coupling factor (superfamily II helicase)
LIHPAIRDLFHDFSRQAPFQEAVRRIAAEHYSPVAISGLTPTAKALHAVMLWEAMERPILLVVDGNKEAETVFQAIETFFDLLVSSRGAIRPQVLPAFDVLPHQRMSPHAELSEKRAVALWRLANQKVPITVLPIAAALLKTEGPDFYRQLALHLRVDDEIPFEDLIQHLASIGYQKRDPVEMVGEYSVRGGILDVFPPEASHPVRVEFFGDTVDSIRQFDVETQRSVLKVQSALILPLLEYPGTPALYRELQDRLGPSAEMRSGEPFPGWELVVPLVRPRQASVFSLVNQPLIVWDEPEQIKGAAERLWKRLREPDRVLPMEPEAAYWHWDGLVETTATCRRVEFRELDLAAGPSSEDGSGMVRLHIPTRPSMSFQGKMQVAVAESRTMVEAGNRVVFFAASTGELERLADIFQEYSVPFQVGFETGTSTSQYLAERAFMAGSAVSTYLVKGNLPRGTVFPEAKLALFGSEDLFETSELVARQVTSKSHLATFAADLADLKPGDFVVHAEHGIGRFQGIRELAQGEQKGDYMLLEYAGESKLYVPLARMDLVQKFRGGGEAKPALDRMGGATWTRTKQRVKTKMRDMADELIRLYAERRMAEGFPFSADSNWQREFEDAFEYTETKDQFQAVQEIKRDMEDEQPMDRLLCGDVGFGKTEVAMRAAFKALGDGKQVAVLAPTTVLAFQHQETFRSRFAPFPVRVEMLSRFRSPKELKATLEDLAAGKVDVIIGTHRLLSKDVVFSDLGLLIVDEEQRFGVGHKERLKQLKKNVDVLTMSATPIPRTLHMSLLGLRDMSVIETPPKDRLAIQTVVAHFNPDLIKAAIEQELSRGGQVYFIHNRVDSIFARAALIQDLAPQSKVGVGHGQMGEAALEKVLLGFMKHDFDVFVSTTIVENGLDIPLANTIIIDHAERYGLSELYQLRGRVGRSNRRAYAYLLVPEDAELSEVARKRLAALREFSDLGAGFKIAALDLELRGAGNLLGGEQHGHINSIGFDMYVRMLDETVRELKGEEIAPEIHTTLNLGLDIRIPSAYISDEHQRLRAYKQIADADTEERGQEVLGALTDRYGPAPEAVVNLVEFSLLKSLAARLAIELADRRQGALNLKFHQESRVDPEKLMGLVRSLQGAQFTPAGVLRLPLDGATRPGEVLSRLKSHLVQLLP